MEWGSSSWTPSRAASRISSATATSMVCPSSSSPSGNSTGPSGICEMRRSARRTTWSPVRADTGMTSDHSKPTSSASCATSLSRSARTARLTVSVFVTIATIGLRRRCESSVAMNRSPGPTAWSAGMHRPTTSTLVHVSRTWSFSRSPSRVRGRWRPGVSTMISWPSGSVDDAAQHAPRRLRAVGGDGDLAAHQRVGEGRLAGVGTSDEAREAAAERHAVTFCSTAGRRFSTTPSNARAPMTRRHPIHPAVPSGLAEDQRRRGQSRRPAPAA